MNVMQLYRIVENRDYSLSEEDVIRISNDAFFDIQNGNYDFGRYRKQVFTKQGKKRITYQYPKNSTEDILSHYLKRIVDQNFKVKYASRAQIMRIFFNILPTIKDMNDFVLVRVDFKSFFDSVLSKQVYDRYVRESALKRNDKDYIRKYVDTFKYCYAGLCLSNGLTEIICRDFDERVRARLSQYGVVFYERYVDDILVVMNRFISQDRFLHIVNSTIKDVFGDSPVRLNTRPDKFSFLTRRQLCASSSSSAVTEKFNFLGYEFEINCSPTNEISFKFGITKKKINRYTGIIEKAFIDYKRNKNDELLRQRIKLFSSRVVIARTIGNSSFDWLTKGVVANYNELRFHMDDLTYDTKTFFRSVYLKLWSKTIGGRPIHYIIHHNGDSSIYELYSTMERNRTLVFEKSIGVSRSTLVKWINRLDPAYYDNGKDYYSVVMDYLERIKVE